MTAGEEPGQSVVVTATSDNPSLIPDPAVSTVPGNSSERTLIIAPAGSEPGVANITVTATDSGGASVSNSFAVNVLPANNIGPNTLRGDFNRDGEVDADDIDELFAAINSSSDEEEFDLSGNGMVDTGDVDVLVEEILETVRGDANLDRKVDIRDFLALSRSFNESGGWADGNFDRDSIVGIRDFLSLSRNFGFDESG